MFSRRLILLLSFSCGLAMLCSGCGDRFMWNKNQHTKPRSAQQRMSGPARVAPVTPPTAAAKAVAVAPVKRATTTRIRLLDGAARNDTSLAVATLLAKVTKFYLFDLARCDAALAQRRPGAGGKFELSFALDMWGMVTRAAVVGFDAQFNRCAAENVGKWRFASPKDDTGAPTLAGFVLRLELMPRAKREIAPKEPVAAMKAAPTLAVIREQPAFVCPEGTTLHEQDQLHRWCVLDGQQHGPYESWYNAKQRRETREYVGGLETGHWTRWYPDGSLFEQKEYHLGKLNGAWTNWYAGGKRAHEYFYREGSSEGTWVNWCLNGAKYEERTYAGGRAHGVWSTWYQQLAVGAERHDPSSVACGKQKAGEVSYRNGKRHGVAISWHRNGKKSDEGEFAKDERVGSWKYYDDSGELLRVDQFKRGRNVKKQFYKDGKIDSVKVFRRGKWMVQPR